MKTRLTITVDRELVPKAKRYASARGLSLSAVIERALRELVEDERPSFSQRWRGRFVLREDVNDDRYQYLVRKYSP